MTATLATTCRQALPMTSSVPWRNTFGGGALPSGPPNITYRHLSDGGSFRVEAAKFGATSAGVRRLPPRSGGKVCGHHAVTNERDPPAPKSERASDLLSY